MTAIVTTIAPTTVDRRTRDTPDLRRHHEDGKRREGLTAICHRIEAAATTTLDVDVALHHTVDLQIVQDHHQDDANVATPARTGPVHHHCAETDLAATRAKSPRVKIIVIDYAHNHLGRTAGDPQTTAAHVADLHHARAHRLAGGDAAHRDHVRDRTKADSRRLQEISSRAQIHRQTRTVYKPPAETVRRIVIAVVAQMQNRLMAVQQLTRWVIMTDHPIR